ncbi:MAG: hypothetical protein LBC18_16120 [Opitutaceae bacterium]|jgi:hypothetical protein|nr:hypothetical protein [Opitutaceae bacterium]
MKTPAPPSAPSAALAAALLLAVALAATACSSNRAGGGAQQPQPPPGPPVAVAGPARPAAAGADGSYAHDQRLYGDAGAALVSAAQALQIINEFRAACEGALKKPRMLIYINRDLVTPPDKNIVVKTTETTSARPAGATTTTTTTTIDAARPSAAPAWSLADRQTARDIERLTARPYRAAGATFADQKIAASMLPDSSITSHAGLSRHLVTEDGRKDREALAKVADIVIEVLMSSRSLTMQNISGAQTAAVPDIQMTAIRLSDAAILGQASSLELIGANPPASAFDVQAVTEATALVLMQDITATAK